MKLRHLLLLSVWGATACAENTQYPPVTDDSVYQSGAEQPAGAPSSSAMIDLLGRMEQLQNEVHSLRGQVEEQAHALDELKRRQDNIYTDVDGRLQKLEGGTAGSGEAPASADQAAMQPQTTEAAVAPEPQTNAEPFNNAAIPESSEPVGNIAVTDEQQPQAEETPAASSESIPETAAPVAGDEKQLYQNAYSALKNGQYDQAITLLKQLSGDYPNGEYADNAYYWLGETYKIKQDADASRAAFEHLLNNYPTSPKVPDAMLKLGFLELEQNNPDKARELFNTILKKYAGSSAANLASNKLKHMDRP